MKRLDRVDGEQSPSHKGTNSRLFCILNAEGSLPELIAINKSYLVKGADSKLTDHGIKTSDEKTAPCLLK